MGRLKSWITLDPVLTTDSRQLALSGYDLYSGSIGVVCFSRCSEGSRKIPGGGGFATNVSIPVLELVSNADSRHSLISEWELVCAVGVSSLCIHSLKIAEICGNRDCTDAAKLIVESIPTRMIADDRFFDIFDGSQVSLSEPWRTTMLRSIQLQ